MLVISSRISGWRVTDSITLPKMYPTPMPGPIVPSPAPTPRAIDLRPSAVVFAAPMSSVGSRSKEAPFLVPSGVCLAEVDRCERGKDEGLQCCDQADLEHEERDRDRQRDPAEERDPEQDGKPASHEQDQQVPGEDVREQSDRQRDD